MNDFQWMIDIQESIEHPKNESFIVGKFYSGMIDSLYPKFQELFGADYISLITNNGTLTSPYVNLFGNSIIERKKADISIFVATNYEGNLMGTGWDSSDYFYVNESYVKFKHYSYDEFLRLVFI